MEKEDINVSDYLFLICMVLNVLLAIWIGAALPDAFAEEGLDVHPVFIWIIRIVLVIWSVISAAIAYGLQGDNVDRHPGFLSISIFILESLGLTYLLFVIIYLAVVLLLTSLLGLAFLIAACPGVITLFILFDSFDL